MKTERKVDSLGRIVIPMDFRKKCDIEEGDSLTVETDGSGTILLKKAETVCVICKGKADLVKIKEKHLCRKCAQAAMKQN